MIRLIYNVVNNTSYKFSLSWFQKTNNKKATVGFQLHQSNLGTKMSENEGVMMRPWGRNSYDV